MVAFTTSQQRNRICVATPELSIAFSLEDGGLCELRRVNGSNVVGFGRPMPVVDVRLHDRGWLANQSFVRYLHHSVGERDGAVELCITIGIGPLIAQDRYRITGTLVARTVLLRNVGEDPVQLYGMRLLLPWVCVGALESCRFDAPGNRTQPYLPLTLAARYREGAALPTELRFERAPTEGPGVLMLHDPDSEETLACWYYSLDHTALPLIQGNDRALTFTHEVEIDAQLAADDEIVAATQYLLLLHEPWQAALSAIQRTWRFCGMRVLEQPVAWLRDAAIYETHPALWGGFAALTRALPRLQALGLNTVCLLPIWDFANTRGQLWDGNWAGSGNLHALRDFEQLDPTLGSADDLRALVAAAHVLTMRVLLDLPLEGCAIQAPLLQQHPEWFCSDTAGQPEQGVQLPDSVAFDWAQAGLRVYMLDWALRQLQHYQFDGFRITPPRAAPQTIPQSELTLPAPRMGVLDLLERLRAGIGAQSGAALIGALEGPLYEMVHDGALHEVSHHMFMQLGLGRITPGDLGAWLEEASRAIPRSAAPICFTEYYRTPLISPLADGLRGSRLSRMLLAGMVLCGFVPLIGHDQDKVDGEFLYRLLHAREEYPALRYGQALYNVLPCSSQQVFAVLRTLAHEHIVGILNVGPHKHTITLSLPVDRLGLAEGNYELFELFTRQVWEENGCRVWARDDLLAVHLTLEPFLAYGLVVRTATIASPTPDNEASDAQLTELLLPTLAHCEVAAAVSGRSRARRGRAGGSA